jgi:hypothetical protein
MKKIYFLTLCLALCACDNTKTPINGYCVKKERVVTTTEQDGQLIKKENTEILLCKCTQGTETFMIPQENFSYKHSQTDTFGTIKENVAYTVNTEIIPETNEQTETQTSRQDCDKQCTEICKKFKK